MLRRYRTKLLALLLLTRVAAYTWVSDESQVDGHSLDAQLSEITRWCHLKGYELVAVFTDAGVSAYTDKISKRPDFARLLDEADAGAFDVVVVHTLDRWARNSAVLAQSLARLGKAGVGFASVTEQIDHTTPAGQMILTTLGAAQQFFSAQTGVHVRKAHREKASKGIAVGPAAFGLMRPEPGAAFQIVPEEAEAVEVSFQMRRTGISYGQIAAWLNDQGCRTRKGRRFTGHAVKDILGCRLYIGLVRCGDEEFEGKHEAIVDRELFDGVQRLRKQRTGTRLVHGARGVLQGRVGCIRCGHPLHSDRQHRTGLPMYRERHAFDCETNNHACMAGPVNDQIGSLFGSLAIPEDWPERIATLAAKRGCRRVDIASLQERKRRVYQIHEDGGYGNDAEYKAKLAEIEAQIRTAQPAPILKVAECLALFKDLPALWAEATPEERSRLIAPLVERVYIDVETRWVAAITPAEGFGSLVKEVLEQPDWSACVLLPAEAANQSDWWTWWRRGRIELPVQVRDALSLLQAYPDRFVSPLTPAAGPVVVGQSMVLGARYRHCARSAPDESSLTPIPPGVVWGERHCLGSEGELSFAVYVLVTTIKEIDDPPPPATQIRRSLSSPFVPVLDHPSNERCSEQYIESA